MKVAPVFFKLPLVISLEDGTGGEQGGFTGSPSHKSVVTAAHRTTTLAFVRFTPSKGRESGGGGGRGGNLRRSRKPKQQRPLYSNDGMMERKKKTQLDALIRGC